MVLFLGFFVEDNDEREGVGVALRVGDEVRLEYSGRVKREVGRRVIQAAELGGDAGVDADGEGGQRSGLSCDR